jgi:hypothetical protein
MLSDHYCAQHFYQKLAEGLPSTSPFKCPQCNFQSKTQLALVRHVGSKHQLIRKLLQEDSLRARARSPDVVQQMLSPGVDFTNLVYFEVCGQMFILDLWKTVHQH